MGTPEKKDLDYIFTVNMLAELLKEVQDFSLRDILKKTLIDVKKLEDKEVD